MKWQRVLVWHISWFLSQIRFVGLSGYHMLSLSHFRIHQGTSYLSPSHRLAQREELHEGLAQRVSHAAAPRRQLFVDPLTTGAQVLWHRLRRNRCSRWISRSYRPPPQKKKLYILHAIHQEKHVYAHIIHMHTNIAIDVQFGKCCIHKWKQSNKSVNGCNK